MTTRNTAVHEAGHAVIGRVLTLACGPATINADHESAGHAIIGGPWFCIDEWETRGLVRGETAVWHARIIALMAGREAVEELLGHDQTGDEEDVRCIKLMLEDMPGSPATQNQFEVKYRRHRSTIQRVAGVHDEPVIMGLTGRQFEVNGQSVSIDASMYFGR